MDRPERRLKMNARRRSPLMLAFSVVTALGSAPAAGAARAAEQRRQETAAAVTDTFKLGRPGAGRPGTWQEVGGTPSPSAAVSPPPVCGPPRPEPRLHVLARTGWQYGAYSTGLWRNRSHNIFSLDLGMTYRGDDGHHWGGCLTGFWYGGYRRSLAVKLVRRWTLEEASGSFFQLSPGILAAGEEAGAVLTPGGLLEAELGNEWVSLTTGVQVQPWSRDTWDGRHEEDTDVIWTLGVRTNAGVGAVAVLTLYMALVVAFATSSGGWN